MWWLLACREDPEVRPSDSSLVESSLVETSLPEAPPPNVLVVVLDDVGTDKIGAYAEHPLPPATPNIDALAGRGTLFRNAWAYTSCSPTRAALVTGRYGRRTGVGTLIDPNLSGTLELRLAETTLPEMLALAEHDWSTSLVGKWHLSTYHSASGIAHPGLQGFDWFAATMGNLGNRDDLSHPASYYEWQEDLNGVLSWRTEYTTTAQVDRALERIEAMPSPWFLYLAFNASHAPYAPPPAELVTGDPAEMTGNIALYHGTTEAMDAELGRLFSAIDPSNTVIILLGDNGTPDHATLPPNDPRRGKDTMYEGGINVPLIVAGPMGAPGTETAALVHAVDVFATVADIAGVDLSLLPAPVDGQSLLPYVRDPSAPGREFVYTERFQPNGYGPFQLDARVIRDARFKLVIEPQLGIEQLFDLQGRYDDGPNLLETEPLSEEASAARERLHVALDALFAQQP